MAAKFEVYADSAGKYRFPLKSANGEIVARGEGYESHSGAKEGCEAVRRAGAEAAVVDVS